jgi:hypothetical protein
MDNETAHTVLGAIAAVGAVVWFVGLQFLYSAARKARAEQPDGDGRQGWLTGSAEVDGDARALASRAASILAKGSQYLLSPVKIVEKTDDLVRFERIGEGKLPAAQWFRVGELRFVPLGSGRTRVEWGVEPIYLRGLLIVGSIFLTLGLVALAAGYWLLDIYIASSPIPAVRWQVLQMLQAVHFLWPPFLFGALYRRGNWAVAAQFDALAHNLPYHEG